MTTSALILAAFLSSQVVSLDAKDVELADLVRVIAATANMNVVIHPAVQGKVSLTVKDAPWEVVLDMVLKNYGFGKEVVGNTMRIAPAESITPQMQTRTYYLQYTKAAD